MKKILLVLMLCFSIASFAGNSGIRVDGTKIILSNSTLGRVIDITDGVPSTVEIVNKLSGNSYNVESQEFELNFVFAGFGPAYNKMQNGENNFILTNNDFAFIDYSIDDKAVSEKSITFHYRYEAYLTDLKMDVTYTVYDEKPYQRKQVKIKDDGAGIQFLHSINMESLVFQQNEISHGEFGQPVFVDDLFLGTEYPGCENSVSGTSVETGYIVGKKITGSTYTAYSSVLGVAVSASTTEKAFLNYTEDIKVHGTRPYLLYNSWYDFRNPSMTEDKSSMMTEENVIHRINTFKEFMYDKYGIALNAFVLDDGWDNYNSIWEIDTTLLPHKFSPFLPPLKDMNTSLGIWASPFCGYSFREKRVQWGYEHGYEKTGEFLCFAGNNYKAQFKKKMTGYVKDYNLGYLKWDGLLLACNETDHGHLPGLYSREAQIQTYIEMMQAVREINPDIFINITVGSWLSPWWLQYADCVWMQGEDYAYAEDVPSRNPRDKSITYRDAVLWQDYQQKKLVYPMSSLMTHGVIKGRLNFLGGENEALDSFTDEVVMYFGRGVTMWELYVSPDLLSEGEWNAIASSLNWAKENIEVLKNFKMVLGNPLKREPYGYTHLTKQKGIVLLRNPYVEKQSVEFELADSLGEMEDGVEYVVTLRYPYQYRFGEKVKKGSKFKFNLNSYEIAVLELVPADKINDNIPVGKRFSIDNQGKKIVTYNSKGCEIPGGSPKIEKTDGKISLSEVITLPDNMRNAKAALLFKPDSKITEHDNLKIETALNGEGKPAGIEQENGMWYWITLQLDKAGDNNISFSLSAGRELKGNYELWITGDEILSVEGTIEMPEAELKASLPVPYPADVNKVSLKISEIKL